MDVSIGIMSVRRAFMGLLRKKSIDRNRMAPKPRCDRTTSAQSPTAFAAKAILPPFDHTVLWQRSSAETADKSLHVRHSENRREMICRDAG